MSRIRTGRPARLRVLKALGTLAHNRAVTVRDAIEYLRYEGVRSYDVQSAFVYFKKRGWLRSTGSAGHYYPTKRGWRAIELAHKVGRR